MLNKSLRCVRNINETHNYLYCEYVTGMMTYFDLRSGNIGFPHFEIIRYEDFSSV